MALPSLLPASLTIVLLTLVSGSGNDLRGNAILTLRQNLRRLQHDEIISTASNINLDGKSCALNISHLPTLEMKVLSTSVPGCDAHRVCQEMLKHGTVELCEVDFKVDLHHTPNDAKYSEQWGLPMIEAEKAWDYSRGNSGNTIIAIIDTGITVNHPDLKPNLWVNPREIPGNGIDDDRNGWVDDVHGFDSTSWSGSPDDETGHGTHCAGIAGAAGNNGIGVTGVAHGPKIMGLKFISASGGGSSGSISSAIQMMEYAMYNGAKVSSMSFGSYQYSRSFESAIERAQRFNHIVVASAGNEGTNNDVRPNYPCGYQAGNVICVGASWIDDSGGLAYFSNYGPGTVDVAAPGHHIYSTYVGNGYAHQSGSSMAAPFAGGLAALLFDRFPTASWKDIRDAIVNTADVSSFAGKVECGRINARRAMEALATGRIPRTCNGASGPVSPVPGPAPGPDPVKPAPRPLTWYGSSSGWTNDKTYDEAQPFCQKQGRDLCLYHEYCPSNADNTNPEGGQKGGDQWAPYSGEGNNQWVQVGSAHAPCRKHAYFGSTPTWGTSRTPVYYRSWIACCGEGGPAPGPGPDPDPAPVPRPLTWYGVSSGWTTGSTFNEALPFCQQKGSDLCAYSEYCPSNIDNSAPEGGQKGGDQWAPYSGEGNNQWVQVGSAHAPCRKHTYFGSTPTWGTQSFQVPYRGWIACCGKAATACPTIQRDTADQGSAAGDISNSIQSSAEDCQRQCTSTPTCNAFVWVRSSQQCYLKAKVTATVRYSGVDFGLRCSGQPAPAPGPGPGPPPIQPAVSCSFESAKGADGSYCGMWFDDGNDQLDWTRKQGVAQQGAYSLYMDTNWKWNGDTARLISKPVQLGAAASLSFQYSLVSNAGNLRVGLLSSSGQRQVLWSKSGDQGRGWKPEKVVMSSGGLDVRLFVEVGFSSNSYWWGGSTAIDMLVLDFGGALPLALPSSGLQPPEPAPASSSVLFAVMNSSACAENLPFSEQRISESSSSFLSTADADVAHRQWIQTVMPFGSPSNQDIQIKYAFQTTRSLRDRLEIASATGEPCNWTISYQGTTYNKTGTFWFSDAARLAGKMESFGTRFASDDGAWGAASGHVNGNCRSDSQASAHRQCPSDFWGVMNNNDQDGKCNQVYTGDTSTPTVRNSVRAFMYMIKEAAVSTPPVSSDSGCVPPLCYSCGFESAINTITNTYCSLWRNDRAATAVWTRNFQPTTPSSNTGPTGPAEGQHYLYFEVSSPRAEGDMVRLKSVSVELTAGAVLSFRYHMLGSTVGSLQIKVTEGSSERIVWQKAGEQGDDWQSAVVKLGDWYANKTVEVSIEAVRGSAWTGDIAIDSVTLDTAGGFVSATTRDNSGAITFGTDSSAGQVDVTGLNTMFGALRVELPSGIEDTVTSDEGMSTIESALYAIFGREVQVLGVCSAAEAVDALCSSTRLKRNLTVAIANTSAANASAANASAANASLNTSLHVDYRVKIGLGSTEDASQVLGELARFEDGNADALDECRKELWSAFGGSKMSCLQSPQPAQLKYKEASSDAVGGQGQTIAKEVGTDEEEDGTNISFAVILGIVGGVLLLTLTGLVCLLLVRWRRRNRAAAAAAAAVEAATASRKVDPNPEAEGIVEAQDVSAKANLRQQAHANANVDVPVDPAEVRFEDEDVPMRDAVLDVKPEPVTDHAIPAQSKGPFQEGAPEESTNSDIVESDAVSLPSRACGENGHESFAC